MLSLTSSGWVTWFTVLVLPVTLLLWAALWWSLGWFKKGAKGND